jgi:hypothetical protein
MNPKGVDLFPTLSQALINRYKFKKFPPQNSVPDESKEGIKFESGSFVVEEGQRIIIMALTIYADGVIADTRSTTAHSDAFLIDVLSHLSSELGIPSHESIVQEKKYLSQLFVSTDKSFDSINQKLKTIATYLSKNVYQGGIRFEFGGMSFWADQTDKFPPPPFSIERVVNVPFSENRYYTAAPLPTDKHLEVLNKLESILS